MKTPEDGGWPIVGPSPIAFTEADPVLIPLDEESIEHSIQACEAAAQLALTAGFKVLEIRAAHGYLLQEFLSPISNRHTDQYGGSLEKRMRLVVRIAERLRSQGVAPRPLKAA